MHRSRPFVLVILAAAAACSKRDPSEGNDILSQDRTLVARLENDRDARRLSLPNACGTITVAAPPSAAHQQQAEELTRQAGVAEMHGNIREARSLLRRASDLDATNKSAAYHLGRTSEALGERSTAMASYCRYLALAPTAAESAEARQRVADLSRLVANVAGNANDSITARRGRAATTARRSTHPRSTSASHVVASSVVPLSVPAASSARVTGSPNVVPSGSAQPQQPSAPSTTSTEVDDARRSSTAGGDVIASRSRTPTTDPAPMPSRTQRRGSIGAQSAIIGAATGAILGATTGRSMKSTVIGAAAGGILGTVLGSATRPM